MVETTPPRGAAYGRSAFLLLAFLGFLLYSPSFHGKWVYDDNPAISANDSLADTEGAAKRALAGRRTFTDFTFALNRKAGGLDPFGYHLVNVAIHVLCAFLVFRLGRRLAARAPGGESRARFVPFAAALLFLCHPLFSQAVAYTAQRYTSLATLFYLLSLELYLEARRAGSARVWIASFASAFLGMRCKEFAFTLPVAIVLAELWFHRGRERRLGAALPFLLLLPLIPLSLLRTDEGVGRNITAANLAALRETAGIGRWSYLATQSVVLLRYLGLLFVPVGLTIDHGQEVLGDFGRPAALGATAVLAAITFAAWRGRRRFPLLAVGWAWFLLTSSVESSIVPIRDVMVEHRMYLPSTILLVAVAAAIGRLPKRGVVLAVLLVPLAFGTWSRAKTWSDPVLLWEDAAAKTPGQARPYVNLALAHRREGRFERAAELYEKALSLDGTLVEAMYGFGLSLEGTGRREEALHVYRRAREVAPDYGPAYDAEAELLNRMGKTADAVRLLRRGLELCGEEPRRLHLIGDYSVELGNIEEGGRYYRRALRMDGDDERAAIGVARSLIETGRPEKAVEVLAPFFNGYRGSAHLFNTLGIAHLRLGERIKAEHDFRTALRIDPGLAEARANLERLGGTAPGSP